MKSVKIKVLITLFLAFDFLILLYGVFSKGFLHARLNTFDTFFHSKIALASPVLVKFMLLVTYLANLDIIIAAMFGVAVLLVLVKEQRLILFFLTGLIIGDGLVYFFKTELLRARPSTLYLQQGGYAFPSGHAFIATVFYGFLGYCIMQLCKNKVQKIIVGLLTALVIVLIGISRVILGVHWPTDVVGGWLLGGVFLTALIAFFRYTHAKTSNTVSFYHMRTLLVAGTIVISFTFFIWYYYVTHSVELRSIDATSLSTLNSKN